MVKNYPPQCEPDTKYVGDITCLPLGGGKFCYPAAVIDLASRRLAGWAIADHMRADLVTDAQAAAVRTRGGLAGSIMHTDHGAQYTSRIFAEACRSAGVWRSMSAVGSSADSALAESSNATFERETLQGRKSRPTEREAPTRCLPTAPPLQGPAPTLPPRTTITDRLRERPPPHTNYAGTGRIAPCSECWVKAPHNTTRDSWTPSPRIASGRPAGGSGRRRCRRAPGVEPLPEPGRFVRRRGRVER